MFLVVGGCSDDTSSAPDAGPADATVLEPCDPPLALTPDDGTVGPYSGMQLIATGGTGTYSFEISTNESGGAINGDTGTYSSGSTIGVSDTVVVTDLACDGRASVTIDVVSLLRVEPLNVEMIPGTSFTFDVSGGSGNYMCSNRANESGGNVTSNCTFTAGSTDGVDIVRIEDTDTGNAVDATLRIQTGASLRVAGGGHLFIPEGNRFVPSSFGGSGHLDIQIEDGPISRDGSALVGDSVGVGHVRFTDRYTGMERSTIVSVVPAYAPSVPRDGERSGDGTVHTVGDLNGDGYADGVMAFTELSIGAHYSGAVMVYAGGSSGLANTPVQVFGGTTRNETLGRDIEVADIDNDGHMDLLIGGDKSDQGFVNGGAVFIHRGIEDGFFEEEPVRILRGESSGDRFGFSLVACDFDADGYLDLAVGAIEDENVNVPIPPDDQGAVHVFRGAVDGFSDKADFVLYGELPDGDGNYRPRDSLLFGEIVRAGDLDGDGLCDLVAGTSEGASTGSQEDGALLVYKGTTDNNNLLTRQPVRFYADTAGSDGNFASALEIADINGDGIDDLAIAQYRSNLHETRGGAVYVYLGDSITDRDPSDPVRPTEADWMFGGTGSYDYAGQGLAFTDIDGDDRADLLIGVSRAEEGSPFNVGHIYAFAGTTITADIQSDPGHDATSDTPAYKFIGTSSYGRLGQAVGGVGQGGVLSLAGYDNTYGTEAGAAYYMSTNLSNPRLLNTPGEAAGHEFGRGLALYDVDNDGDRDFVIGGPGAAQGSLGGNSGMVFYYRWDGDGVTGMPLALTNEHYEHDGSDRYGYAMSSAGDFNGDGIEDLAIIARGDEHPDEFETDEFVNPEECLGPSSLTGATKIYLGQPSGLSQQPAFVAYGNGSSEYTRVVRGGFDFNNDGYDDVLMSAYGWDGYAGGFSILYGRAENPAGATVLCTQERYLGVENFSYLGASAAVLGDMDEDGCDDLAIGAPREDMGVSDQGVVRILWGYGGPGCAAEPAVTTLVLTLPYTRLGSSLDGGRDIDGDGILDLAVGGAEYRIDFSYRGAAWMVPGSYVQTLPRQTITPGNLPTTANTDAYTLLPELGDHGRYGLVGTAAAGLFGESVALIPDPVTPGRSALAVGIPRGDQGGVYLGGGVVIHRYVDDALDGRPGLDSVPYAIFGGETSKPEGLLGQVLQGYEVDGVPTLLVGAPISSQRGLDIGAGYILRFTDQ